MKFTKAQIIWGVGAGENLTLEFESISNTNSYVVKSITGLEPTEVVPSIVDKIYEGGVLQGKRPSNREIVVTLGFQPDYSVGEDVGALRKRLYLMFSPKPNFELKFRLLDAAGTNYVETPCVIKRMESNPFSKDPEIVITISCLSAYFSEPLFTHPSPTTLSGLNPIVVNNTGDVPTGFYLSIILNAAMSAFTLTNSSTGAFVTLTYAFLANDRLVIETIMGSRRVVRVRSGVANLNLLPYMSVASSWITLEPGTNNLVPSSTSYTGEGFRYTIKHGGF